MHIALSILFCVCVLVCLCTTGLVPGHAEYGTRLVYYTITSGNEKPPAVEPHMQFLVNTVLTHADTHVHTKPHSQAVPTASF